MTDTVSSKNSTTVRAWSSLPALLGAIPGLGTEMLTRRFLRPWTRVDALPLDGAEVRYPIRVGGQRVLVGAWGKGPTVLLVHGWSGGGSQFALLRERLVEAGHRVVVFDGPAHGGSPGTTTHLGQFAELIEQVALDFSDLHAIVGHSVGALAAALANARGVSAEGLVLLAPLPSFDFALDEFQRFAGFSLDQRERVARRIERIARVDRRDITLERALEAEVPTLVVHDETDRRVPLARTRELVLDRAHVELVVTTGLGHKRVLSDADVLDRVVGFVRALPSPRRSLLERSLVPAPRFD